MAISVVTVPNLGNEFDLGVIEANKIHVKIDSTIVRSPAGVLGVNASALAITNALALSGTNLTSTVNGNAVTVDLGPAIKAGETLTTLTAGTTAAAALTYVDEHGASNVINLTNAIKNGETLTVLGYNPTTKTLTYTDEHGGVTSVDLSALAVDIYVNGASFNPTSLVLTLTDNSGATPDITVDLSTLKVNVVNNGNGTYTISQAGNSYVVDTRDGISADTGNLLILGSDLKPMLKAAAIAALATVDVQDAFGVHQYNAFP